jgi:hypothetical protein
MTPIPHSPFLVLALPRSRTAWVAELLTYGGWSCYHQQAVRMRSLDDCVAFLRQPRIGSAETSIALGWRLLLHRLPDLRIVTIRRPIEDCVRSMMAVDLRGAAVYDECLMRRTMAREARALDEIEQLPGVLRVEFADLGREDACAAVFEHCLPFPFDRAWWLELRDRNIQADVPGLLRYYQANRRAIDGFKAACRREMSRLARAGLMRKEPMGAVV